MTHILLLFLGKSLCGYSLCTFWFGQIWKCFWNVSEKAFMFLETLNGTSIYWKDLDLCFSRLTSLQRNLRLDLPLQAKLTMCKSFLLSTLLYGSEISRAELLKSERFQIKSAKWICSSSSYRDTLLKCKLLRSCCLFQFKDLIVLSRILTWFKCYATHPNS